MLLAPEHAGRELPAGVGRVAGLVEEARGRGRVDGAGVGGDLRCGGMGERDQAAAEERGSNEHGEYPFYDGVYQIGEV